MSNTLVTEPEHRSTQVGWSILAFFLQVGVIGVYLNLGFNIIRVSTNTGYLIIAASCLVAGLGWMWVLHRSPSFEIVKLTIAIDFLLMTISVMKVTGLL